MHKYLNIGSTCNPSQPAGQIHVAYAIHKWGPEMNQEVKDVLNPRKKLFIMLNGK